MTGFLSRADKSEVSRWWWSIDRWLLLFICILMFLGGLLSLASSQGIAQRIGLEPLHFAKRHFLFLGPAFIVFLGVSFLTEKKIRLVAWSIYLVGIVLLVLTPFLGAEVKGARRWINIGFSLQASELVKSAFAIVSAILFSRMRLETGSPFSRLAIILYCLTAALIIIQPDLGMVLVISGVWFVQFFLAGLPLLLVGIACVMGVVGIVGAYFIFPHVHSRIDRFLNAEAGDNYQVQQAMEAFRNGGFFGQGPGEGHVKHHLPDAHADFIFAIVGEELGLLVCIVVVLLYALVLWRGIKNALSQNNLFRLMAIGGLITQFSLQAIVNMASSLHLIPTKGMTLPFLSYGGSSLLALAFAMGVVLSFSRRT